MYGGPKVGEDDVVKTQPGGHCDWNEVTMGDSRQGAAPQVGGPGPEGLPTAARTPAAQDCNGQLLAALNIGVL